MSTHKVTHKSVSSRALSNGCCGCEYFTHKGVVANKRCERLSATQTLAEEGCWEKTSTHSLPPADSEANGSRETSDAALYLCTRSMIDRADWCALHKRTSQSPQLSTKNTPLMNNGMRLQHRPTSQPTVRRAAGSATTPSHHTQPASISGAPTQHMYRKPSFEHT